MPGTHDYDEKKHKERVKKLKAKTSKMRLAVVKKKNERKLSTGHTVAETYNTSGQQQRDILQQAGVSPHTSNTYEKIPKGKDKRKIRKEIIRNDNLLKKDEREKKLYD